MNILCGLNQVRDSDVNDPYRKKTVQLLDDFRIASVNGNRIFLVECNQ